MLSLDNFDSPKNFQVTFWNVQTEQVKPTDNCYLDRRLSCLFQQSEDEKLALFGELLDDGEHFGGFEVLEDVFLVFKLGFLQVGEEEVARVVDGLGEMG